MTVKPEKVAPKSDIDKQVVPNLVDGLTTKSEFVGKKKQQLTSTKVDKAVTEIPQGKIAEV